MEKKLVVNVLTCEANLNYNFVHVIAAMCSLVMNLFHVTF